VAKRNAYNEKIEMTHYVWLQPSQFSLKLPDDWDVVVNGMVTECTPARGDAAIHISSFTKTAPVSEPLMADAVALVENFSMKNRLVQNGDLVLQKAVDCIECVGTFAGNADPDHPQHWVVMGVANKTKGVLATLAVDVLDSLSATEAREILESIEVLGAD
jgi:hypothetical protein